QVSNSVESDFLVNFEFIKIGSVTYNITDIAPLPHHPADLLVDFNDITGGGAVTLTDGYQGFNWDSSGSYFSSSANLNVQQDYDGVNTNPYMSNGFAGQTSTIVRSDGSDFSVNSLDFAKSFDSIGNDVANDGATSVTFIGKDDAGATIYSQNYQIPDVAGFSHL